MSYIERFYCYQRQLVYAKACKAKKKKKKNIAEQKKKEKKKRGRPTQLEKSKVGEKRVNFRGTV